MSAYVPASAQAQQSAKCFNGFISAEDLADCRRLADAGDTEAMLALAEGYARGFLTMSRGPILLGGGHTTSIPPDQNESLRYYKLAAEMGGDKALRHMFEEYKFGGTVPKNEVIADQYLTKLPITVRNGRSCCWRNWRKSQRQRRRSHLICGSLETTIALLKCALLRLMRQVFCQKKSDAGILLAPARQGESVGSQG